MVVLHLFAGGYRSELREWPDARWRELAGELDARGFGVVLTGAEHERERAKPFAASCELPSGRLVDLAGRLSLTDLLDVVAGSALVVSVNTGLMHIAGAAGVPTVALNGPTSEHRWGPVGEACVSVNSRYHGCGFLNLGGEYRGRRGGLHGRDPHRGRARSGRRPRAHPGGRVSGSYLEALAAALREREPEVEHAERWGRLLAGVLLGGGRLLVAGNGGSAADAQHLAAELVGRFTDRSPGPQRHRAARRDLGDDRHRERLRLRRTSRVPAPRTAAPATSCSPSPPRAAARTSSHRARRRKEPGS